MAELVRTIGRGADPITSSIIWFPTSIGRVDYVERLARVAAGELWLTSELADGDLVAGADIVAIARAHADRIARAAPPAPWVLAGWALGALVALEAARILAGDGNSIRLLLALESKVPDQPTWSQRPTDDETLAKIYLHHRFSWRGSALPSAAARTPDDIASLLREHGIEPDATVATVRRDLERFACHVRAVVRYHSQPFGGPIASCEVKANDIDYGWGRLGARVTRYDLEGDHLNVMSDAHVAHTALTVRRALDDG